MGLGQRTLKCTDFRSLRLRKSFSHATIRLSFWNQIIVNPNLIVDGTFVGVPHEHLPVLADLVFFPLGWLRIIEGWNPRQRHGKYPPVRQFDVNISVIKSDVMHLRLARKGVCRRRIRNIIPPSSLFRCSILFYLCTHSTPPVAACDFARRFATHDSIQCGSTCALRALPRLAALARFWHRSRRSAIPCQRECSPDSPLGRHSCGTRKRTRLP